MALNRRSFLKKAAATTVSLIGARADARAPRPNILFAIADDWSWPHASIVGASEVHTPAFDRVATEGILFTHCYDSAPSCTPSRGAILTGQYHWRLEEGGNLWSILPAKFKVYPDILEEHGYRIGYTGKGWSPGDIEDAGRSRNPAGPEYNRLQHKPPFSMHPIDYAANFRAFLDERPADQPFCFWYGGIEPHRPYEQGMGVASGKNPAAVQVPAIFPDAEAVRSDILDYYVEIENFDAHLGKMVALLQERGELENTLIVVTSDNGMPFPRAKSNLYRWGTNMPLAVRWGDRIRAGQVVDTLVSQTDFAPTFLEAAGISPLPDMTGKSLLPLLTGREFVPRDHVLVGKERHAWVRPGGVGYPCRAIRTSDYLYIRNFKPDRWPAGDPVAYAENDPPGAFADIDDGPTKFFMMNRSTDPQVQRLWESATAKRPEEELYDLKTDPDELNNVAGDSHYSGIKQQLSERLMQELAATNDPRAFGSGDAWDHYEYYAPRRKELKRIH